MGQETPEQRTWLEGGVFSRQEKAPCVGIGLRVKKGVLETGLGFWGGTLGWVLFSHLLLSGPRVFTPVSGFCACRVKGLRLASVSRSEGSFSLEQLDFLCDERLVLFLSLPLPPAVPPSVPSFIPSFSTPSLAQCTEDTMMNTSPALGAQSGSRQMFNSQVQEKTGLAHLINGWHLFRTHPVCQARGHA